MKNSSPNGGEPDSCIEAFSRSGPVWNIVESGYTRAKLPT